VRKGEKGVHIFSPPFQIKEINEETNEERIVGIAYRSFVVFNRAQCGEVEESSSAPEEMEPPVFAGESRILNYFQEDLKMKINIQKQDSAFYRPSDDSITMPTPAQFEGWESFDGTLLHEAAHWTKAPNRLDRNHPYAKEELVAELASTFGAYRLGIKCDFPNSASYLNGWLSAMKKDPSFLHKCVQDSVKAIEYLFPELKEKYE
jgi:antirestriction protein ArdC